jgi:hypothetical protein
MFSGNPDVPAKLKISLQIGHSIVKQSSTAWLPQSWYTPAGFWRVIGTFVVRAIFAAALSLALPGLGHLFLGQRRGIWFAVPGVILLYLHFAGQWEFADVTFLGLAIFAAFDAFSIAHRGYGIV